MVYRPKTFPTLLYIVGFTVVIAATWIDYRCQVNGDVWEETPAGWGEGGMTSTTVSGNTDNPILNRFLSFLRTKEAMQKKNAGKRAGKINQELAKTRLRLEHFSSALINPGHPSFAIARQGLTEETIVRDDLEKQKMKCTIHTGKYYMPSALFAYSLLAFIYLMTDLAIVLMARKIFPINTDMGKWITAYLCFMFLMSASLFATCIMTGIISEDNTWIGPKSFFVCPGAWTAERVAHTGLVMIVAVPMTRLWRLTRRELMPVISSESLADPEGKCGVGGYVNFLGVWTNLIFITFALITVIGLRSAIHAQHKFDSIYLIPTLTGFAINVFFAIRMIRNGLLLRERYKAVVKASFPTLQEKEASRIAGDPTIDYIGEKWWKIPVTLAGIVGSAWAILQWAGISKVIENVLK